MLLSVNTFVSLDGVYQAPGGRDEDRSGGFEHGGWVVPFSDDDFGEFITGAFEQADAFLLGRRMYESWAAHWPPAGESDPVSAALNTKPKYVASTTLDKAEWDPSTILEGDLVEAVEALKRQPGRELQVHGSGRLARSLAEHGLVDRYRLLTFPVVLGSGRRLFEEGSAPTSFRLVGHKVSSTGVQLQTLDRVGAVEYGDAG
jgi:dihydrofolate reductase